MLDEYLAAKESEAYSGYRCSIRIIRGARQRPMMNILLVLLNTKSQVWTSSKAFHYHFAQVTKEVVDAGLLSMTQTGKSGVDDKD